jgi:hypothetical protein
LGFTDDYFHRDGYVAGEDLRRRSIAENCPGSGRSESRCRSAVPRKGRSFLGSSTVGGGSGRSTARRILLLHNDLKPGNIRLTEGDAIVLDFGAAEGAVTQPEGHACDFGSTVPPPSARSGDRDAPDAWALGVLM